jgi:NADP-dependent 3-hydroxy acid dehydrogenase YdfG
MSNRRRTALVTGASSGIGGATARALAAGGLDVIAAARRLERCEELAREIGGRALRLDVTDDGSVMELARALPDLDVLINNAGGALGTETVTEADEEHWRQMYETNVLGIMRVTKALAPALERSGDAHIVVMGSVVGIEVYPGGRHPPAAHRHRLRLHQADRPGDGAGRAPAPSQ